VSERYADYDAFAWFYNRYWGATFADRFLAVIEQLFLSHLPAGARVLDLCCGTGQLARALSDQGFRVTGLDGSEAMLALARVNAPGVEWVAGEARRFVLPATYHGVLSTFDSLNHIMTIEELTAAFRSVHAALLDGGRFLFDLNMEEGYRARWRGARRWRTMRACVPFARPSILTRISAGTRSRCSGGRGTSGGDPT